jgi:hypothetical protein
MNTLSTLITGGTNKGEILFAEIVPSAKKQVLHCPYDFVTGDRRKVKIEVKFSKTHTNNIGGKFFQWNRVTKRHLTLADRLVLIAQREDGSLVFFAVPVKEAATHVTGQALTKAAEPRPFLKTNWLK